MSSPGAHSASSPSHSAFARSTTFALRSGCISTSHDTSQRTSAVGWKKKEVRINTRLVYTQNKFNLLREESEGYSKLVVALAAFGERGSGDDDAVAGAIRSTQARSISRRFPYDRVGAVNADP